MDQIEDLLYKTRKEVFEENRFYRFGHNLGIFLFFLLFSSMIYFIFFKGKYNYLSFFLLSLILSLLYRIIMGFSKYGKRKIVFEGF